MERNARVTRFFDALNTRDAAAIRAMLAPDFVFEEVAGAGDASSEALLEELRMIFHAFPDITFRPVRHSAAEGREYIEFLAFGTHQAEFLSVPATRSFVTVSGVFNVAFHDDLVGRMRLTVDFGGLRRQLLLSSQTSGNAR